MRYRVMLLGLVIPALLFAQDPQLPRFRAGANLVRADVYVSKDGVALTDLKAEDFVVYEDDKPQQVESFELIKARGPNPQSERVEPTTVRDLRQEMQDSARVFTLFFDRYFVQLSGSFHARKPIIETLDKVIGPDDLVGAMTSLMAPTQVTYSKRTRSIESYLTENWTWGERGRDDTLSTDYPVIKGCMWDRDSMILKKYREQQTIDSLTSLVDYLEGLRPERKFVMVFTEGWPLYRSDDSLAGKDPPVTDVPTVDPRTGGLRKPEATEPGTRFRTENSCARTQSMLAFADHEIEFRQLLQRANRANVSFYPIDARGLIVCDNDCNGGFAVDNAMRTRLRDSIGDMAAATDGRAIVDATDTTKAMQKVFADVGSYYLLGYYSTNQKLDGRFRRIRVEVTRDGVDVRSRPGYLAPTESEARAAGAEIIRAGAKPTAPPTVTRALDALAPARGFLPVRVQAVGGRNTIRAVVELDASTLKQPEWISGGTLKVTFEPERKDGVSPTLPSQSVMMAVDPGQRSIVVDGSDRPLAPGRYSVRAELTARNARQPIQITTFAIVPADNAEVGSGLLALRRGPSTGLAYVGTADPRFRRTERLRVEVPLAGDQFTGTGRLLTREGQATALNVTFTTRTDDATMQQFGVGEVILAPLAEGEYVLELSLVKNGKTDVVSYGFRVVP
jgi:VWFA-related protein